MCCGEAERHGVILEQERAQHQKAMEFECDLRQREMREQVGARRHVYQCREGEGEGSVHITGRERKSLISAHFGTPLLFGFHANRYFHVFALLVLKQEQRFAERLGQSSTRVSGDDVDKQTKAVRQSSELFAAMDVLACCVEAVSDEKLEVSMWSRGFKTRTGCEVSSRQPVATLPFRSELDATLFGQLVRSALHVADAGTLPETFIGFESLNSSALALKMTVACHSQSNVLLVGTEVDPGLLSLRPSNEAHWGGADTAASESRGSLSLFAATASQSGSIVDTASEARPNFIPDEARSTREIPVAAPDPRLQTTRFRGHTQGRLARSAYDRWGDTRSLASWETPPHALSRPVRRGPQTQHPELRPHAARAIQKLWRHRRPNLLYPKSYSQAALVLTPIVADESLAALSGCVACFLTGTPVADRIE